MRGKIKEEEPDNSFGQPASAFTRVENLPKIGQGMDPNEADVDVDKCPEVILLGTSEALAAVEAIGFKAEEAFLEDSAVRMIRQSTKNKNPFNYVLLDLDDNTIDLGRFNRNVQ